MKLLKGNIVDIMAAGYVSNSGYGVGSGYGHGYGDGYGNGYGSGDGYYERNGKELLL